MKKKADSSSDDGILICGLSLDGGDSHVDSDDDDAPSSSAVPPMAQTGRVTRSMSKIC